MNSDTNTLIPNQSIFVFKDIKVERDCLIGSFSYLKIISYDIHQ